MNNTTNMSKLIYGGYLPNTNSVRNHPIVNLTIKPSGWKTFVLSYANNKITYNNQGKQMEKL